jgi:hypothetical protein
MSDISQGQSIRFVGYFPAEAHKQNYSVDDIPASLLTTSSMPSPGCKRMARVFP